MAGKMAKLAGKMAGKMAKNMLIRVNSDNPFLNANENH